MAAPKRTVARRTTISQVADLNQIAAFVRVMEVGSFTAAAEALSLPKSSVSRMVAKLEQSLGVTLMQRTTRKLLITDAGKLYLEQARHALSLLTEAQTRLREAEGEPRGLVRFTAPVDPSGSMLSALLSSFVRKYPCIQLDLLFTQRRLDLVAEGVDLALRAGRLDDSSLVGRRLGYTPLCLVAAPAYLNERGTPRRLAQLSEHECLLFRAQRNRQRWTLTGKRGVESVQVAGAINVDELTYLVHLAREGVGIAMLPELAAEEALREGKLVRVLPSYRQHGSAVYLVHPATPHLPRRVALLRDHLFEPLRTLFTATPAR
jgi:DNA-binding transcriptional LysR family regulator